MVLALIFLLPVTKESVEFLSTLIKLVAQFIQQPEVVIRQFNNDFVLFDFAFLEISERAFGMPVLEISSIEVRGVERCNDLPFLDLAELQELKVLRVADEGTQFLEL